MYKLFIWLLIYMCYLIDVFDLKNIVKFRRNEKKLCGRVGGGGGGE